MQQTVAHSIHCQGVGLHSGRDVRMTLHPAPVDHGIVFVRSDVEGSASVVPANYLNVSDTRLCTVIENGHGIRIGTVEHVMAALWGLGIDNVRIVLDGPEVPIMDGSSEPFVFLIECAGIETQEAPRRVIVIDERIFVEDGESVAVIEPHDGFALDVTIAFAHDAIGTQQASYDFTDITFKQLLSRARTFGFAEDVAKLRSVGLARGGSLANAVVVGESGVMNAEGLRFSDEFVRHKALDCVGDYYMAGHRIRGRFITRKPGHGVNNKVIKAIFANKQAWHFENETPSFSAVPVAAISAARSAGYASLSSAVHLADK